MTLFVARQAFAKPHCNSKKRINFPQLSVDGNTCCHVFFNKEYVFVILVKKQLQAAEGGQVGQAIYVPRGRVQVAFCKQFKN